MALDMPREIMFKKIWVGVLGEGKNIIKIC